MPASWVPQPGVFDGRVGDWVSYVESVPGRLRHDETLHHLREHLRGRALDILDLGTGIGELAAALAREGQAVTAVDYSAAMLAEARRRCAGLPVNFVCADAIRVGAVFEPESFDVALCHSLLEFVDSPDGIVAQVAEVLRPGGLVSVLVGNRYHAPLRKALLEQDIDSARLGLEKELPGEDLFGLPRRTFCPRAIHNMVETCGFRVEGEYGVRIFSDLLGEAPHDLDRLLALELAAAVRMPYCHMARFIQFVAVKE